MNSSTCAPRVAEAKEGNCSGERTGRQSGTGVKNAAPSGENAEQNRNTPAGRFISSPLFSYRCCRNVCCAVPSRRHARLSPARALSRQPVSVFCLHSFTRMPHCVVSEGVEGEGLWYFKFTCVHRARMRAEQSVGTRGGSYFLAYGAVSVHFIEVRAKVWAREETVKAKSPKSSHQIN